MAALSPHFDGLYAARMERPSIPPERLLRTLLLRVLFAIRSERQLMEQLDDNLLFRCFVGLNPDDAVWVPTVCGNDHDRLIDGNIAKAFLQQVLKAAEARSLLSHEHFTVDGTLLEAWEIHRASALFPLLRGIIDEHRAAGERAGLFLLLGSASLDLQQQAGESLAGRAAQLEPTPIVARELATNDARVHDLEREIPMFAPRMHRVLPSRRQGSPSTSKCPALRSVDRWICSPTCGSCGVCLPGAGSWASARCGRESATCETAVCCMRFPRSNRWTTCTRIRWWARVGKASSSSS